MENDINPLMAALIADKRKETRFFVDTCILLNEHFDEVLKVLLPHLEKAGLKLILPNVCMEELYKHSKNPDLKVVAKKALKLISENKENFEIRGNADDGNFADKVFLRIFTQFREKYCLVLLTEDRNLRNDIVAMNKIKSVSGKKVYAFDVQHTLNLPDKPTRKSTPTFKLCTELTTLKNEEIDIKTEPNVGDIVYLPDESEVKLCSEIQSGGEGTVYNVTQSDSVAKIYHKNKLTTWKKAKLDAIISSGLSVKGVCLPSEPLYNRDKMFVGYLMPKAKGKKLDVSIFKGEMGFNRYFAQWSRRDLVTMCITLFSMIEKLHREQILIGDINGSNILVESPTEVYIVDTDSFQINGIPCPVGKDEYTAPEIMGKDFKTFLRTKENENFALATLLFRILMYGMYPYAQLEGSDIVHNIKSGNFSFPYRQNSNHKIPKGNWCYFWSHLFFKLKENFFFTFSEGEKMFAPSNRPDVTRWLNDLRYYLSQIDNGKLKEIDEESLSLFPKRFKKYSMGTYARCECCGKETDVRYMDKDHRFCSECLNSYKQTQCKRCNNYFPYKMIDVLLYNDPVPNLCPECYTFLKKEKAAAEEERKKILAEEERQKRLAEEERQKRLAEEERKKKLAEKERQKRLAEKERKNETYCTKKCSSCGKKFTITVGEYEWFMDKYGNLPKRCKTCRDNDIRPNSSTNSGYDNNNYNSYGNNSNNSGGCFVTTAVCDYLGKPDNCEELTMLRSFRDNWLSKQPEGKDEIGIYYDYAPAMVEKLKSSPKFGEICEEFMRDYIRPCLHFIKEQKEEQCRQLYIKGVKYMMDKTQI